MTEFDDGQSARALDRWLTHKAGEMQNAVFAGMSMVIREDFPPDAAVFVDPISGSPLGGFMRGQIVMPDDVAATEIGNDG